MSNKKERGKSEKTSSILISSKDFKPKLRYCTRKEKTLRWIVGGITGIFLIVVGVLMVQSIMNQQFMDIIIYSVIIGILILPNEIIEKVLKKKVQKRRIQGIIEERVEKERVEQQPFYHPTRAIGKEEGILVFVSYATKDAEIYKIRDLAARLTKHEKISDVLYWQEDMKDNIIKYMNDNLDRCDIMILFCSPNALVSEPVEKEWTAADIMGKPIIPIFNNSDHIPPLLKTRLGLQFDPFDLQKNVTEVYNLILKKLEDRLVDIEELKPDF
jgi:hypothetical protein